MISVEDILDSRAFADLLEDMTEDLHIEHGLIDLKSTMADHELRDNAYKMWALREIVGALETKAGARAPRMD